LGWKVDEVEQTKTEIDYRVFFALGVCFMGLGVVFTSAISLAFVSFLGCGVVFMIIGLAKRDQWAKSKKES
jgi:hypothetical protein